MKKSWILYICMALFSLLIAGCSEKDGNENAKVDQIEGAENEENAQENETDGGQKLYHEIGETFEFMGNYPVLPIEVTVNKIWMESGDKHKQYIEENVISPEDNATVTFIDYTVTNKGDETLPFNDVIPQYYGADASLDEIDLSYPENDLVEEYLDAFQLELEPGESIDIVGSVATTTYSENGGAFIWAFMDDIPKVVFQTPQEERKDKIGIYDMGEDMYVIDQTDERQLIVTIEGVDVVEDEDLENTIADSVYIKVDMHIENAGTEKEEVASAFPDPVIDGEIEWHSNKFKRNGLLIDDPWNDPERIIEPGEKLEGQVYIEVGKDVVDDVQLYYFDSNFLTHPEYSMIINYNLK